MLPASDPIHKATIIPRGRALGMVMRLPEDDRVSMTREKLKADIAVAMGGRVAEELIFGYDKVTSGASSDIKMATNLARRMVTQWGMSDEIGPVLVGDQREEVFLGHTLGHENKNSDALSEKIDAEVRKLVDEGYSTAQKILTENMKKLHLLAENLLEYETLTGDEIRNLMNGKPIDRTQDNTIDKIDTPSVPTSGKKRVKPKAEAKDKPQEA
jgi:cell division protease FtsH